MLPDKIRLLIKILLVVLGLVLAVFFVSRGYVYAPDRLEYGVTFSKEQAEALGLDWKEAYLALFNDLGVKKIRLSAYWDEVEPEEGSYSWDDLDWQIKEADKHGARVILAVGERLPRWPECHFPGWTDNLTSSVRDQETLAYIREVVLRYIGWQTVVAWQVENEPFLPHFGECPPFSAKFLDEEIALVKELDDRPVVITDSGELSVWIPAAKRADIFGTSIYRDTYSRVLGRYIHYPITPGFFRFKRNVVGLFAHPQKWIVIELQAEPWAPVPFQDISPEERGRTMDPQKFDEIIEFARQAGFREFYLWGAEWWYWEKTANDNPEIWEKAKQLFEN